MAITDDYVILGASGDNFDCDDTGGWTKGGNAEDATAEDNRVEGDKALGLTTSDTGDCYWYHDIADGSRFKITEKDLGIWFYYIKGKGANFLVQDSTAIMVKLYFGGTSKYAEYRLTTTGDLELDFGWQMLMCSGTNLRGGEIGGGHDDADDWNLDIHRFELHFNVANKVDVPLGLDAVFIGTEIDTSDGDETTPTTFEALWDYAYNTRSGFPIGVVDVNKNLVDIRCGIKVSGGYLASENQYLLFNQFSSEVKHHVNVTDGTFRVGRLEKSKYPMLGGGIAKPAGMSANFMVGANGAVEIYNSKMYRWTDIHLDGACNLGSVDFDSDETVFVGNSAVTWYNITIHDATNTLRNQAVEVQVSTESLKKIRVYNCKDGIHVTSDDCKLFDVILTDNTDYDVGVTDAKAVAFVNSTLSTMRRL